MKTFPHKQFLQSNKIKIGDLPNMLQKRIKGFEELLEDIKHTVEEDELELLEKIDSLSLELEEDLYELFEDRLENNDEFEDENPPIKEKQAEKEEKKKELTDHDILEKLYKMNRTKNLEPSSLIAMGFKTELEDWNIFTNWNIQIGGFLLKRNSFFSPTFDLIKTGK